MQEEKRDQGYFLEEHLDRMNLKTMANPIEPYTGHELMALLVTLCDEGMRHDPEMEPTEARDKVVEWYCSSPADAVRSAFLIYQDNVKYHTVLEFQRLMHERPDAVAAAIKKIQEEQDQE